ncbi:MULTISPECIES: ParB/RepB/Spo0J family partition protein [unclassified Salinivibrio]|uniref:ParB/RepB/Spo0J family partition protein n=1 Tax=unclassified Salinivibrio TaxID=2636825 RepID=UPI00128E830E|nr:MULTISPECIES: ParB/RepB/Spo0J family partition protein [unclassified Salinivibrio]MPS33354.1 ParB/RepB/Spo0J family partition protein [Salinivibrio sp. VYel7]MPX94738.1 ParB/RepB/Spo0J family partition protein [Salinivibrio sp. VYel9]MPX97809.1 ParB/RepB/Spo0J family partition protein [Salinivibrio sp. VYel6]MPY01017.1 ParB/RepB/Spo0J family partition protein [Salinivibrio sp. VYel4]MPY04037.1 ParB/RepB/Spo0J family partition protein [Salinivibrio sp. VYel5]
MNSAKRGLGKGLDALLATSAHAQSSTQASPESTNTSNSELQQLPVTALEPGQYQPRQDMAEEALEELTESIRAQGIIQPLVVRQVAAGRYEIIAGERRWRAAKQAGLNNVPCLVREMSDKVASAVALIENIQRENLNAMEEAQALARLVDEFELTHQQLAESLGKSRATISNLLRLNGLESGVRQLLLNKQLEMGHARALLALEGDAQIDAALTAVNKKMTVRQIEKLVKKMLSPPVETEKPKSSPEVEALQQRLGDKLGASVALTQQKNGSGKLVINFEESEKLAQILAIFDEEM